MQSGYLSSWIVSTTKREKSELNCSICQCIFREPSTTNNGNPKAQEEDLKEPCGHVFCENCITSWLTNHNTCPICRRNLDLKQITPEMRLRRKIRNLRCKCHNDPINCASEGTIGRDGVWWKEHAKVCLYEQISCPLCSTFTCIRRSMSQHTRECPKTFVGCPRCGEIYNLKDKKEHESNCLNRPIVCKDCKQTVSFSSQQFHLENLCPLGSIPCNFSTMGCSATFLRKDEKKKEEHLQQQLNKHMDLLIGEVQKLRARLDERQVFVAPSKLPDKYEQRNLPKVQKKNKIGRNARKKFAWSLPWSDPSVVIRSGILVEAFGGKWGFGYGNPSCLSDSLPLYLLCYELEKKSLTLEFSIAIIDPRTGKSFAIQKLTTTFQFPTVNPVESWGWGSHSQLSSLKKAGVFDESKGLTTLLLRATLCRIFS